MSKFRTSVAMLLVLSSLTCVLVAKPKYTPKQKARMKCDAAYVACSDACPKGGSFAAQKCERDCSLAARACYNKAGISSGSDFPTITTTEPSPGSTPKSKAPPKGPLSLTSPTATPSRTTHLPQGTLTQASPTPTATAHEKKKKN
jgi:hypothetical protein